MLKPVLDTAPASPLFTTAEVKANSRIDFTDDDVLFDTLIAAVTAHLDGYSGILSRALLNQTWHQNFAAFGNCMRLPLEPVSAITSVKYYDSDNAQQTLDAAEYTLLTDSLGAFMTLAPTKSWPGAYFRPDAIEIKFVAGYGAAATDVPQAIRQAALMLIGAWYENRENIVVGVSVNDLPMTVGAIALLGPYKRTWVA